MGNGNFWESSALCKAYRLSDVSCAETAEPVDLPFGLWTRQERNNFSRIRRVAPIYPDGRARWRNLANTIEQPVLRRR